MSKFLGSKGFKIAVAAGIPLVTLMISGAFLLSSFVQTNLEVKDSRVKSISKRKFDLEEEHAKLMGKLDIDNFTLSRIPRPEDERVQKKQQKAPSSDVTKPI